MPSLSSFYLTSDGSAPASPGLAQVNPIALGGDDPGWPIFVPCPRLTGLTISHNPLPINLEQNPSTWKPWEHMRGDNDIIFGPVVAGSAFKVSGYTVLSDYTPTQLSWIESNYGSPPEDFTVEYLGGLPMVFADANENTGTFYRSSRLILNGVSEDFMRSIGGSWILNFGLTSLGVSLPFSLITYAYPGYTSTKNWIGSIWAGVTSSSVFCSSNRIPMETVSPYWDSTKFINSEGGSGGGGWS